MDSALIVAHGTRSGDNSFVESHAAALSSISGLPVRCAYRRYSMEKVRPAMESLADEGYRDIAILPFFMYDNVYVRSTPKTFGILDGSPSGIYVRNGAEVRYRMSEPFGVCHEAWEMVAGMLEDADDRILLIQKEPLGEGENPAVAGCRRLLESRGYEVSVCTDKDPQEDVDAIVGDGTGWTAVPMMIGSSTRLELKCTVLQPIGRAPGVAGAMSEILSRLR
ncbi:MAG: CbiX/SirB N-terminal domain-containing protein [Thermoplasmata archaeon]|nr:CbiX/SirB N-terminal domain-containing protein [Thermoplasmata archaeon]